jgi:hypothetical protein
MNWYLIVKYLLILAVTITVGGMFARQWVRGIAKRSDAEEVIIIVIAALMVLKPF